MTKTYLTFICFVLLCFSQTHGQTTLNLNYAQSWGVGTGGDDYGKTIAVDALGNSYVAGNANRSIDLDPSASTFWTSGSVFFLAKYSSTGTFIWAKTFSGTIFANAITLDASNNIYITGYITGTGDFDPGIDTQTFTVAGNQDAFFAKYDASGNYVFAKSLAGYYGTGATMALNGYYGNSRSIAIDASLNIYITGGFGGTVDFDPDATATNFIISDSTFWSGTWFPTLNAFVAKYNANGEYLWSYSIGDQGEDEGYSLALDASSNVYITGNFWGVNVDFGGGNTLSSYGSGSLFSTYLAKYTSSGVFIWADMIGGDPSAADYLTGDPPVFITYSLKVDAASNAYITGAFQNTVDFDPDPVTSYSLTCSVPGTATDAFIAKYDASGSFVFAKQIVGTNHYSADDVIPSQMTLDPSGNIIITGTFSGEADFDPDGLGIHLLSGGAYASPPFDFFVAKYDPSGAYTWAFNWGTEASTNIGYGIATDPSGNVYVTGAIVNGTVAADLDPDPLATQNFTSKVANSLFVAKYDPNSAYLWAFTSDEGDGGNDIPGKVAMDSQGNTYIVGTFLGTIDFDKSAAVHSLQTSTYNYTDIVFAKYNKQGNYLWAKKIGGSLNDKGLALVLDASGSVYITGNFAGTVDFDPDPNSSFPLTGLNSTTNLDMFLAKYDGNGNFKWVKNFQAQTNLIINPTSLAIDSSSNVFIGGYFINSGSSKTVDMDLGGTGYDLPISVGQRCFLAKYDSSGVYSFAKLLNSPTSTSFSRQIDIAVDASGNSYITGYMKNIVDFDAGSGTPHIVTTGGSFNAFIAKYSPYGSCIWANKTRAVQSFSIIAIAIDTSANIYITGSTNMFFAKYDSAGTNIFDKSLSGTFSANSSIAVNAKEEILLTGNFSGTANFDPGTGTENLTSNGGVDFFIAKYDAIGDYLLAKSFGGIDADVTYSVASNVAGDTLCVFGSIKTPGAAIDFDPDLSVADTHTPLSGTDMFLAKYSIGLPRPIELVAIADNNIDCNLQCTGKATVTATRGTWPYTYLWNPGGATTNALTDLCEGTYTLTVTDAASVATTATLTVSIDQPSPVKGHIAGPANVCSDKLTMLNAVGGTCNVFLWNTGETTASIATKLSAPPGGRNWTSYTSTYSLTVSHNGLCPGDTTFTITVTPNPTVTITGAGSLCSGSSLPLDASGSATGGGNYMWSTGESTTAISASPLSTTTYSLVISTAASCGDTAWASIAVTTTPTAHITASKTILCSGDSAILTRSGTADNYLWSNGETKTSLSVKATENFTLTLSRENCSDTDTITVSVFTMPTAVITGETSICSGKRNLLSATQTMPGLSYQWNTGASTQGINEYPLTNTTYSVILVNSICRDSASLKVFVTTSPTLTLTANKTIICAGETAILQGGGSGTFQWSTGDAANTINAIPASSQHFSLSLSNGTCSAQDSVLITVIPMPTASISGPVTICNGNSTSITASSGGGASSYIWSTGESTAAITILPLINRAYSVTASNGNGLCTDTTSTNITLITAVPANAGSDITMAMGLDTVLSANDGAAWSWAPKYQIDCNTCQRATVRPFISTNYTLTVTDNNGCMSSDTVAIYIIPCEELFIPQAFSPNNDGKNDVLYIRGTDCIDKIVSFTIYNRWGEKVFESTDIKTGWDGTVSGLTISNDVFIYYLETLMINGETKNKMGNVTLMK